MKMPGLVFDVCFQINERMLFMLKRNIYLLYGIAMLQGLVFYSPVATLYRQAAGVTMLQISVIESISLLLSLLLEMPWGVVADRIGYRSTMIFCSGLFFLSKIIFWKADAFSWFLLERILLAVVISGLSGVDSALLHLSCPQEQERKVFAVYTNLGTVGLLLAAMLFSLFIGDDYRLAGAWTVVSYGAAMLLSLFLREPEHTVLESKRRETLVQVIRSVLKRPRLLLLLLAFGLFNETVQNITVFLNQLQYERAGISANLMGFLLMGVTAFSLLGVFSPKLVEKVGERRTVLLLLAVGAVSSGTLALTVSPVLSVVCVAVLALAGSSLSPIQAVAENRQVLTDNRATELSVYAMLLDTCAIGTSVMFGKAADISLQRALWIACALCVLGIVLYWAAMAKQ